MMPDHSPTWTDILTALGTVGAVMVALILAGGPALKRWWSKPKLRITTGVREPFVRPISADNTPLSEVRLRVGVENIGRSTAREVRAQLLHWWEHDPDKALGHEWQELDSEPLPLKWVSIRPGDDRPGVAPIVAILNGASDYLDLALLTSRHLEMLFDDNRQALFPRNTTSRVGTWRIQFAVGGSNCTIKHHTVEFSADGPNLFTAAAVSKPPRDAGRVGLIALLRNGLGMDEADPQSN